MYSFSILHLIIFGRLVNHYYNIINFGVEIFIFSLLCQTWLQNFLYPVYWNIVFGVDRTEQQKRYSSLKFLSQLEEFTVHIISIVWISYLIIELNILEFSNQTYFGRILDGNFPSENVTNFYIFHILSWSYQLFFTLKKPKKLRDKYHSILILHHLITITLLLSSYYYQLVEFGVLVLFIHDTTDIVVDMCKIFNYLFMQSLGKWMLVILNFFWLYFRIYKYGFFIKKGIIIMGDFAVEQALPKVGISQPYYFSVIIVTLLTSLFVLNCIWYLNMTYITINLFKKEIWAEKMNLLGEEYE